MGNPKLLLNDFEKTEVAASKIIKYFDDRLAKLRIDNDNFDADPSIRGRIAEIKLFKKTLEDKVTTQAAKHTRTM